MSSIVKEPQFVLYSLWIFTQHRGGYIVAAIINMNRKTEKESFEEVYEKQFSNIYNYVYGQVLHKERAEDLVSDIFIKAMTHYDSFDPAKASVRTWLTNIARNTLIDEFRRQGSRGVHLSLDDEENEIDPSFEDEYSIYEEDPALKT